VHSEPHNRGSDAKPLSAADVERKFLDNALRVTSRGRAQRVLDLVMSLDRAESVEALGEALQG
jgi:hypothetical protein